MPHDSVASLRGGKQAGGEALGERGGLCPPAGWLSGIRLFFLPLRDPSGLSGWPGGYGVSLISGLLVPLPGGRQGGGGAAVHAGEQCGCAGGDGAGVGGEGGEI